MSIYKQLNIQVNSEQLKTIIMFMSNSCDNLKYEIYNEIVSENKH